MWLLGPVVTQLSAAGDLTAVPAFLGLTVWRGRQVLNIITKAIGDCSYGESLGEVE